MTTERRIMLTIATSPDGTKCAAECPHTEPVKGHWCDLFGPIHGQRRPIQCAEAEQAAREAEVDALRRGYDIGVAHTGWGEMGAGDRAMEAEIERIRGGES